MQEVESLPLMTRAAFRFAADRGTRRERKRRAPGIWPAKKRAADWLKNCSIAGRSDWNRGVRSSQRCQRFEPQRSASRAVERAMKRKPGFRRAVVDAAHLAKGRAQTAARMRRASFATPTSRASPPVVRSRSAIGDGQRSFGCRETHRHSAVVGAQSTEARLSERLFGRQRANGDGPLGNTQLDLRAGFRVQLPGGKCRDGDGLRRVHELVVDDQPALPARRPFRCGWRAARTTCPRGRASAAPPARTAAIRAPAALAE